MQPSSLSAVRQILPLINSTTRRCRASGTVRSYPFQFLERTWSVKIILNLTRSWTRRVSGVVQFWVFSSIVRSFMSLRPRATLAESCYRNETKLSPAQWGGGRPSSTFTNYFFVRTWWGTVINPILHSQYKCLLPSYHILLENGLENCVFKNSSYRSGRFICPE